MTLRINSNTDAVEASLRVDRAEWEKELETHADWFEKLGGTVPEALRLQRRLLLSSLKAVSEATARALEPPGALDRGAAPCRVPP